MCVRARAHAPTYMHCHTLPMWFLLAPLHSLVTLPINPTSHPTPSTPHVLPSPWAALAYLQPCSGGTSSLSTPALGLMIGSYGSGQFKA